MTNLMIERTADIRSSLPFSHAHWKKKFKVRKSKALACKLITRGGCPLKWASTGTACVHRVLSSWTHCLLPENPLGASESTDVEKACFYKLWLLLSLPAWNRLIICSQFQPCSTSTRHAIYTTFVRQIWTKCFEIERAILNPGFLFSNLCTIWDVKAQCFSHAGWIYLVLKPPHTCHVPLAFLELEVWSR